MIRRLTLLVCLSLVLLVIPVSAQEADTHTFVLVHGAFQDASGWGATVAALEAAGQIAVTVQLPGRGDDTTSLNELTLASYSDAVIDVVEAQDGPVVLVGHSFGGMVISAVGEAIPDQIEGLVYVAAYLPQNGESLVTLSSMDHYSLLGQEGNFILADDFTTASVNEAIFAPAFCPDCDSVQSEQVAASQRVEPLAPLNESVTLTDDRFGTLQKAYILTAEDVVISPQLQALMLSYTPVDAVFALNTGHAPYITQPEALANLLIQAASGTM